MRAAVFLVALLIIAPACDHSSCPDETDSAGYARACVVSLDCDGCDVCTDGFCVQPAACVYVPQCSIGSCSSDDECNETVDVCAFKKTCDAGQAPKPRMICAGATDYGGGRCVVAPSDGGACAHVLDPYEAGR